MIEAELQEHFDPEKHSYFFPPSFISSGLNLDQGNTPTGYHVDIFCRLLLTLYKYIHAGQLEASKKLAHLKHLEKIWNIWRKLAQIPV